MLLGTAFGTASDVEIVWTMVALAGFLVTFFNLRDAFSDHEFLKEQGIENGRRLVSNVVVYTESTRIFIHSVFLSVGIIAAMLPEAPANVEQSGWVVAARVTIRWGLIFSSMILMSQSIVLRWMRNQLRREDAVKKRTADEKMQSDVSELTRYATEVDDWRIVGQHSEQDVAREKEQ